jgi:hypothetical protein
LVLWEKKLLEEFLGFTTKTSISKFESRSVRRGGIGILNSSTFKLRVHLVVKTWSWTKNKYVQQDGWPMYMLGNPRFHHTMNHQIVGRNS